MISLTMKEVLDIISTSNASDFIKTSVPGVTSLRLARILKKLNSEGELYQEKHREMVDKYAKRDENGEVVKTDKGHVTIPDINGFNKEMEEILKDVIELDVNPINIIEFGNVDIPIEIMYQLEKFIVE